MREAVAVPEQMFRVTSGSFALRIAADIGGGKPSVMETMRGPDATRNDGLDSSSILWIKLVWRAQGFGVHVGVFLVPSLAVKQSHGGTDVDVGWDSSHIFSLHLVLLIIAFNKLIHIGISASFAQGGLEVGVVRGE